MIQAIFVVIGYKCKSYVYHVKIARELPCIGVDVRFIKKRLKSSLQLSETPFFCDIDDYYQKL